MDLMVDVTGIRIFLNDITENKNICLVMAFREKFTQKAPKILALRTLEQTLCKTIENPETLINTGFKLGNTWQHPKSPQNEA